MWGRQIMLMQADVMDIGVTGPQKAIRTSTMAE
jgi:hypothetical protein